MYDTERPEFTRFRMGILFELFDESTDLKVRAGICQLFGLCEKWIQAGNMMIECVAKVSLAVRLGEESARSFKFKMKKQIEILGWLPLIAGTAFEPHIQSCFNAVYS